MSGQARTYLLQERAYFIRKDAESAALAFVARMRKAREMLGQFPEVGFVADNPLVPGSRRLVVDAYYMDYDIGADGIVVTAISPAAKPVLLLELDEDEDFEAEISQDGPGGP